MVCVHCLIVCFFCIIHTHVLHNAQKSTNCEAVNKTTNLSYIFFTIIYRGTKPNKNNKIINKKHDYVCHIHLHRDAQGFSESDTDGN